MATGKITKRTVDSAVAGEREAFLWDNELRGFGLKVTTRGAKSYILQYRMGGRGSPTRRYTIGSHGSPWTPATSRDEAARVLQLVKRGIDPRDAARARQREEVDLAFNRYAEFYLTEYGKRRWRPRTYANVESNLRRHAVPVLKQKTLAAITRADITAVLDGLARDKPALARNVFVHLRTLFNWAVERGDIDRSPFHGLRSPRTVASRERVLSDDEIKAVWHAAGDLGFPFGAMVRLLIATGQRREEVAGLNWKELDREDAVWIIPSSRAKNKTTHHVPLSQLALSVLDHLAAGSPWPRTGLVLSTTGTTPVSGFSRAKRRLDLAIANSVGAQKSNATPDELALPWRIHDLRRTMATGLQRLGVRFEVTEALLNHVSGSRSGVAGVYQRHHWKDEKHEAINQWGVHVQRLVALGPALRAA